jgi:methyl-accepting chemotaxis protein
MFALFRRTDSGATTPDIVAANEPAALGAVDQAWIADIARQASTLGREAAEVRGTIDDASRHASEQVATLHGLSSQVGEINTAQDAIVGETREGLRAARRVCEVESRSAARSRVSCRP